MPRSTGVRGDAAREGRVAARTAPCGPDDVVLTRHRSRRMTRALIERGDPIAAALDVEASRVRPDVLTAGDPVILVGRVSAERRDELREGVGRRDVADRAERTVAPAAGIRHLDVEVDVLLRDFAAVVRRDDHVAPGAAAPG